MSMNGRRDSGALYGLKSVFSDVSRKRTPKESTLAMSSKRRKVSSGTEQEQDSSSLNLPDPRTHNGTPTEFLCDLFQAMHGIQLQVKKTSDVDHHLFSTASQEQIAAYTTDVVNMVRENQVDELRTLHQADARKVHCTNQFGESLLHRACRLGHEETTDFLLHDAKVNVRVADDYGRNPLHDTCWNPSPQPKICGWLMKQDPFLFLMADKRGFSPFDYARSHHWLTWKEYLYENRNCLDKILGDPDMLSKFTAEKTLGNGSYERI
jgi:Ankyrin repeats (3 copies)